MDEFKNIMAVDPDHCYSNAAEIANKDICDDDFKFKTPLVSMVYTDIFQRWKG